MPYEEGEFFFFLRGMKGANRGGYLEKCPKDKTGVMIWSDFPPRVSNAHLSVFFFGGDFSHPRDQEKMRDHQP